MLGDRADEVLQGPRATWGHVVDEGPPDGAHHDDRGQLICVVGFAGALSASSSHR